MATSWRTSIQDYTLTASKERVSDCVRNCFLENGAYSDLLLVASKGMDKRTFRVHKMIIFPSMSMIKDLVEGDEEKIDMVVLNDCKPATLESVLKYIYLGIANVHVTDIRELFDLMHYLGLTKDENLEKFGPKSPNREAVQLEVAHTLSTLYHELPKIQHFKVGEEIGPTSLSNRKALYPQVQYGAPLLAQDSATPSSSAAIPSMKSMAAAESRYSASPPLRINCLPDIRENGYESDSSDCRLQIVEDPTEECKGFVKEYEPMYDDQPQDLRIDPSQRLNKNPSSLPPKVYINPSCVSFRDMPSTSTSSLQISGKNIFGSSSSSNISRPLKVRPSVVYSPALADCSGNITIMNEVSVAKHIRGESKSEDKLSQVKKVPMKAKETKKEGKKYSPGDLAEAIMIVIREEDKPINVIKNYDIPRRTFFRHLKEKKLEMGIDMPERRRKNCVNSKASSSPNTNETSSDQEDVHMASNINSTSAEDQSDRKMDFTVNEQCEFSSNCGRSQSLSPSSGSPISTAPDRNCSSASPTPHREIISVKDVLNLDKSVKVEPFEPSS